MKMISFVFFFENVFFFCLEGSLNNYLKEIFIIIFTRLTKAKTQKLIRCIIVFFSYFIIKYGAQELITQVDSIQTKYY